jgi:hypothetical protein
VLAARIASAVVYLAGTVVWLGLSWLAYGLRCDDSCASIGGWNKSATAWQWGALLTLAMVGSLAALAVVATASRGAPRAAAAALGLHVVAFLAWAGIVRAAGDAGFAATMLIAAATAAAGLELVVLARRASGAEERAQAV